VEAAANKIGSPIDQLLLLCYHNDPVSGKYTLLIMNLLRGLVVLTMLALGGFVYLLLKRYPNSTPAS
jgi:protein SCO1/2